MKPNRFAYHDPATIEECVALLAEHGDDAKPLAGGQSLVPLMNLRLAAPAVLVDLNGVAELSYVARRGRHARDRRDDAPPHRRRRTRSCAAPTRCSRTPPRRSAIPRSACAARSAAACRTPIPSRSCRAWPIALGAEFVIAGAGRPPHACRRASSSSGYFTTAMQPGELLVEVRFPHVGGATGWGFARAGAQGRRLRRGRRRGGRHGARRHDLVGADRPGRRRRPAGHGGRRRGGRCAASRPRAESVAAAAAAISEQAAAGGMRDASFVSHVAGVLGRRALTDALERAGSPT